MAPLAHALALAALVALAALAGGARALQLDPFAGAAPPGLLRRAPPGQTGAAPLPPAPRSRGFLTTRLCGGLYNQYAGLVGAAALAVQLRLALVLPDAETRHTMQRGAAGEWTPLPLRALFDVDAWRAALPGNVSAHLVDAAAPGVAAAIAAARRLVPVRRDTLGEPLAYYARCVDDEERALAAGLGGAQTHVHLRLPCAQFAYAPESAGERALVERLEEALHLNATLRHDASVLVARLGGPRAYDAFHLRCEQDARAAWHVDCADARVSSEPLAWLRDGAAPPSPPLLYVATGDEALVRHVDARFRTATHGALGLDAARYGGALEPLAAVDALVLGAAARFAGFGQSSFSFFVARGRARAAAGPSRLAGGAAPAFERAFPPRAAP